MAVELSANVGALYPGLPPDRACEAAAVDGFRAVEFWTLPAEQVPAAESSLRALELSVASINAGPGVAADAFGQLGDPAAVSAWRQDFLAALEVARRLGAGGINLLVGGRSRQATRQEQLDCARRNLAWAQGVVRGHRARAGATRKPVTLSRLERSRRWSASLPVQMTAGKPVQVGGRAR